MAASDELNKSKIAAKETREELDGVIDAVVNIGAKIQEAIADAINEAQGLEGVIDAVVNIGDRKSVV